jgi:hypothetical protein
MIVEFDMAGKRHRAEGKQTGHNTVSVEVGYDYTRPYSLGRDELTGLHRGHENVRFVGRKTIRRHIDKHNVQAVEA